MGRIPTFYFRVSPLHWTGYSVSFTHRLDPKLGADGSGWATCPFHLTRTASSHASLRSSLTFCDVPLTYPVWVWGPTCQGRKVYKRQYRGACLRGTGHLGGVWGGCVNWWKAPLVTRKVPRKKIITGVGYVKGKWGTWSQTQWNWGVLTCCGWLPKSLGVEELLRLDPL